MNDATERRPRVLFVGAFPQPGGSVFGGMVSDCRALMHSTFPQRVELDLFDSTQISNPPPNLPIRCCLALARVIRFVGRFERRRPDAVLLFAAVGGSLVEKGVMAWYARMRGVPALLCPRSGGIIDDSRNSRLTRIWARWAFSGARMVLCQGTAAQTFVADSLGLGQARARVISSWTAVPSLLAIGRARTRAAASSPVRLFFMGWLDREKGVIELLEACRRLGSDRNFTLELAGEGNVSAIVRGFVTQHGLADRVRLLGWLRGDRVGEALAAADVFVLPSWSEGLPNAMVEAMAARVAIVVSAVGSIPDVVVHMRDALLVPPRDVDALVTALALLIDSKQARESLADEAFATAVARFSVEPAAIALEQAIREAMRGARNH